MKKIVFILIFIFVGSIEVYADKLPFAGKTNHFTVIRMKRKQIRKIQKGTTFYKRINGKVIKQL